MKKTDAAKRWLSALLCLALAVPAGGWGAPAQAESAAELNPPGTPAVEEIRQAFEDYRYEELISSRITYAEEPRVSPAQSLKAGALSQETIRDALDGVNLVRFVVGLDEVSEDPLYSEAAQHGAVLLTYRNNAFPTRRRSRPAFPMNFTNWPMKAPVNPTFRGCPAHGREISSRPRACI